MIIGLHNIIEHKIKLKYTKTQTRRSIYNCKHRHYNYSMFCTIQTIFIDKHHEFSYLFSLSYSFLHLPYFLCIHNHSLERSENTNTLDCDMNLVCITRRMHAHANALALESKQSYQHTHQSV